MKKVDAKRLADEFEAISGVEFADKNLILTALCHSSFAHENKLESNERLEFLGDSVLGLVVSEKLFFDAKRAPEGKLSQMRSRIVSEEPLAEIAKQKGFDKLLLLGVGESKNEPTRSMIADEMEAIIGAIYLDKGLEMAKEFVVSNFLGLIDSAESAKQTNDAKSLLQEKYYADGVRYKTTGSEQNFCSVVYVGGKVAGNGKGPNKRSAEKAAATQALERLERKNAKQTKVK